MSVIFIIFISAQADAFWNRNDHIRNLNKNTNTNKQNQNQHQSQDQMQGQTAHNEGVNQTTIFNEAETKRNHMGGSASYAHVGSYNGKYEYGAEYLPIDVITAVKKTFSFEAAFEDYGKKFGKGKCKTTGHSYNGRHENDPTQEIDVYTLTTIKKIDKEFEVIGFLTIKAIKEGTDSFMVMQKGILSAALMQGDAFIVTSEGATVKPKSRGWGIGTFFSGGQIADHGNRGNATATGGGTGFSKTTTELVTYPWQTIQVLKYKIPPVRENNHKVDDEYIGDIFI